jgi:hypothetical protein
MTTTVFVLTQNGSRGSWSRYRFPFDIDAFAQLGNDLYLRHGDTVSRVVEGYHFDQVNGLPLQYQMTLQWPWLDFGQPGINKMLVGLDNVGSGSARVEIGWDQSAFSAFTEPYQIPADTAPGTIIPMPMTAPSFSVRLTYDSGQDAMWNTTTLYVADRKPGSP